MSARKVRSSPWISFSACLRTIEDSGSPEGGSATDARIGDLAVLGELKRAGSDLSLPHQLRHYFYFASKAAAERLGATLRTKGYNVETKLSAHDHKTWLALATHHAVPTIEAIRDLRAGFEALSAQLGGEYDGWEAAVTRD